MVYDLLVVGVLGTLSKRCGGIGMYQTLSKITSLLLLLAFAACDQAPPRASLAPFSDSPDETFIFQHKTQAVEGVVCLFESDGKPVAHGGPVSTIFNIYTQVVEVKPRVFVLPDKGSVINTDAAEVVERIEVANLFCEQTVYTRVG